MSANRSGADSQAISLEAFEQLALAHNPTLVQAGAQINISQGKAVQAGLLPNPTVGYAADQIGAAGTAGELQGVFVEQQIITAGKLRLSRQKYTQEAYQEQTQATAQQYRVLTGVRIAYYELLARKRRVELRTRLQKNADDIATTVEELLNVGQANRADLLQARIQKQRASADLKMSQRRLQSRWEELVAVTGVPDLTFSSVDGVLDIDDSEAMDRDASLAYLLTHSPEICFAHAEVCRDQIALKRERVEPIPNLLVRAESGYNFETNNTVAAIEVGFRLPIFDRNQGSIQQAQSELNRAQAETRRVELQLRKKFARTFSDYEAAMISVKTYRDESLPQAEEAFNLYLQSFQKRRAAWPQVLDAQRDYYELTEQYLDELMEARRAEAQIRGLLLDDALEQPPEPTPGGHRDATPKPR